MAQIRIEQRMHYEEVVEAGQGLKVEFSLSSLLLSSKKMRSMLSASTKTHTAYSPKYPHSLIITLSKHHSSLSLPPRLPLWSLPPSLDFIRIPTNHKTNDIIMKNSCNLCLRRGYGSDAGVKGLIPHLIAMICTTEDGAVGCPMIKVDRRVLGGGAEDRGVCIGVLHPSFSYQCTRSLGRCLDRGIERKSADVEMDLGTYIVPSLWLKPVMVENVVGGFDDCGFGDVAETGKD
ncbi:hypothetical protein KCU76_g122, partial [Aureobasidium melanogenum]